ncbi:exostosin-like glycosyltransferase [Micractinium conductrix]|uniref:Exostosin-like glycosyltransferase n=1 Tax=Micractinium conductrix TaxID=554055 RepID=A0A2P6VM39_9CHLO|nr:exostosin-like glycosyltransferase [Micractinium conductrix]|eukprot:PSC75115.1 exostosin-like glycosyltransferase [Micractinium conductrix]
MLHTKSCECLRRCKEYFCRKDSKGNEVCESELGIGLAARKDRPCYEREGAPPDEQYSAIPEPEEDKVKCFVGYEQASTVPANCSEVMKNGEDLSLPLSKCPKKCSGRGYCGQWQGANDPICRCHRGYAGAACEIQENRCYLKCNGRGKCTDQFCKCEPPYFSIGCSRSTVYPTNHSRPSPVNFKIYMYELSAQLAYDNVYRYGWHGHDRIYEAYTKFMEQFLLSPVRTEDPSEANLFFVPAFTYHYSGNVGTAEEHIHLLLDHLKHTYPYWNRTGGRDHFYWTPADRGSCHVREPLAHDAIRIQHFGMHNPAGTTGHFPHLGHPAYGCFHPLRDVVSPPLWDAAQQVWPTTSKLSIDELIAGKKRIFFFAGGVRPDMDYSGGTRQTLDRMVKEWKDPEFDWNTGGVGNYEERQRESKFCLAPYGFGWGIRLAQAMLTGCVPVIIQEHVFHPYEDILPYESFSLRLTNDDIPNLREILRGVTDEQYRRLVQNVVRHAAAFSWYPESGGSAFNYTIATLRRKHMNLKALYYPVFSERDDITAFVLWAAAAAERTEPGPPVCDAECTKFGNCGEDGNCRCPFGRLGKNCEIDFLSPCKPDKDGLPNCGSVFTKSCECFRRCREWACPLDWRGEPVCQEAFRLPDTRSCYERVGVPPDEQYSLVPEPDEVEAGTVKCYEGYKEGAAETNCSVALVDRNDISLPLSMCPNQCNKRGYCGRWADNPKGEPFCRCQRGYIAGANLHFLEQFLLSSVRTEDPSEANLFYIQSFTYTYAGNTGTGADHLQLLLDHVKHSYPYWNRTDGRDHVLWLPGDRGACHVGGPGKELILNPIKLVHFGMHTQQGHAGPFPHFGQPEYGCYHPLCDVVATPLWLDAPKWVPNTLKLSAEELMAGKKRLFFFAGGIRPDEEYSGNTRQMLDKLSKEWKDPEFDWVEGGVGGEYQERLRTAKFCLAPYGHGWGLRLPQAMLAGCVPVIIQEHVAQPFEDVLPYEAFSIRLSNDDLPLVREILRGVTDAQYRQLLEGVLQYLPAFHWHTPAGGKAFDYTIAALRRRSMHLKALHVADYAGRATSQA